MLGKYTFPGSLTAIGFFYSIFSANQSYNHLKEQTFARSACFYKHEYCSIFELRSKIVAKMATLWHSAIMRLLSKKAYLVLLLGDIGILYLSVWIALIVRHFSIPKSDVVIAHIVPFSLLFIIWFVTFFVAGLYGRYTVLFIKKLPNILFKAQLINIAIAGLFFFVLPVFTVTPKMVLLIYLLVSTFLLYFWRVHIYPHLPVRNEIGACLIGTSKDLSNLAEQVNRDSVYPLEFRAIVHPELSEESELRKTIGRLVATREVTTIVADMGNHALDDALQFIYDITFVKQRAFFIDARRLFEEVFERIPLSLIDDRWVLRYVSLSPHTLYSVTKRFLDIVFAITLGILSLPLYPFILLAIKLENKGEPLFTRVKYTGISDSVFEILKFNTGYGISKRGEGLKIPPTKSGIFLSRTGLEFLPSLWNILIGEMSFVGPEAMSPNLVSEYRAEIRYYNLRHLVRPGLFGWGRLHVHSSEESKTQTSVLPTQIAREEERLAYDLFYIKERSLWLDFYIALKTIFPFV